MISASFFEGGAGRTRYLEAGSGWPVVLLHAFPLNADMWRPQLERVPRGWKFIAPDLRGFGPLTAAQQAAGAMTMEEMAADVVRLLDQLEIERAAIGGLSMGGYVTFALFRMAPERFVRIILADTRSQADSPEGREGRRKMLERLRSGGPAAVAEDMLPRLFGETTSRERPELQEQVRRMIEETPAAGIAGALEALMERPDSTPLLPRMNLPALIIAGAEDVVTPPSDAESMQRQLARSQMVILPGAGHLSNMEVPDAFSLALANFLASNF